VFLGIESVRRGAIHSTRVSWPTRLLVEEA
jgi:hypothetical protein